MLTPATPSFVCGKSVPAAEPWRPSHRYYLYWLSGRQDKSTDTVVVFVESVVVAAHVTL